jgi:ligand-binding sensor domain-containing protein/AraC-like DNA-binding protein
MIYLILYIFFNLNDLTALNKQVINNVFKDSYGIMWFASNNGVYQYNGFELKSFQYNDSFDSSILDDMVIKVFEDKNSNLWVLTHGGLNLYNRKNHTFKRFPSQYSIKKSFYFKKNKFFVSTDYGVFKFDFNNHKFHLIFKNESSQVKSISYLYKNHIVILTGKDVFNYSEETGLISKIDFDKEELLKEQKFLLVKNNTLWLATNNAVYQVKKLNKDRNRIILFKQFNFSKKSKIIGLKDDGCNGFYLITDHAGIFKYNSFFHFFEKIENTESSKYLKSVLIDSEQIWLGYLGDGVRKMAYRNKPYHLFYHSKDTKSISNNLVWSTIIDQLGQTWSISHDHVLNFFNTETKGFTKFRLEENTSYFELVNLDENSLWITTNKGMFFFDIQKKRFIKKAHIARLLNPLNVRYLYKETKDEFWLASSSFLIHFNTNTLKLEKYPLSQKNSHIQFINRKNKDILFVATKKGLYQFNEKTKQFIANIEYKNKLKNVQTIFTKDSISWFGTFDQGLIKLNHKTNEFSGYGKKDGLQNNTIYSILEDSDGDLWLSTNNGLAVLNPKSDVFTNFNDLIPINEFNQNAYYRASDYSFFYGSVNGLLNICPNKLKNMKTEKKFSLLINNQAYKLNNRPFFMIKENKAKLKFIPNSFSDKKNVYYFDKNNKEWVKWTVGEELLLVEKNNQLDLFIGHIKGGGINYNINIVLEKIEYLSIKFLIVIILVLLVIIELYASIHFLINKKNRSKKIFKNKLSKDFEEKLEALFLNEKLHFDSNLKVKNVARKLGFQSKDLSYYLNHSLNTNFNDYINKFRLEEAKKRIINCREYNETISSIAYDVGFNSLTTFINAFKKIYKMTPSAYKKMN